MSVHPFCRRLPPRGLFVPPHERSHSQHCDQCIATLPSWGGKGQTTAPRPCPFLSAIHQGSLWRLSWRPSQPAEPLPRRPCLTGATARAFDARREHRSCRSEQPREGQQARQCTRWSLLQGRPTAGAKRRYSKRATGGEKGRRGLNGGGASAAKSKQAAGRGRRAALPGSAGRGTPQERKGSTNEMGGHRWRRKCVCVIAR